MDTKYYFTGTTIVTGFYNTEDHPVIPSGATECTVEERDAAIEAQSSGKILCITAGKINPQTPQAIASDWDGEKWVANSERQNAQIDELRRRAYETESDPLFFKEQRGEVTAGTWEAKVTEIKARYPKIST